MSLQRDLTRQEAMDLLNIGPTKLGELIRKGDLETYKLGDSSRAGRRIKRESIDRLRNNGAQAGVGCTTARRTQARRG